MSIVNKNQTYPVASAVYKKYFWHYASKAKKSPYSAIYLFIYLFRSKSPFAAQNDQDSILKMCGVQT